MKTLERPNSKKVAHSKAKTLAPQVTTTKATAAAPAEPKRPTDEVADLRYRLWNTSNSSQVLAIAAELSAKTDSIMSPEVVKQVSDSLRANAGDRATVLKIADELTGRTDAVIRLDARREVVRIFRAHADDSATVRCIAKDFTDRVNRKINPFTGYASDNVSKYGADVVELSNRFGATSSPSAVYAIADAVERLDTPKRFVERFRAIADNKLAISHLAGVAGGELAPPPDGHPDAELSSLCKRFVEAPNGSAVRAICDEVEARKD